jgi:hypothetical protein
MSGKIRDIEEDEDGIDFEYRDGRDGELSGRYRLSKGNGDYLSNLFDSSGIGVDTARAQKIVAALRCEGVI